MNLGAPELGVVVFLIAVIGVLSYGPAIWVIVDVSRRPDWQFQSSGQSQTLWIVLPVVGMLGCCLVTFVAFIVYFSAVRPKLERAQPPTWPPYPGPWWGGPPSPPPSPRWEIGGGIGDDRPPPPPPLR